MNLIRVMPAKGQEFAFQEPARPGTTRNRERAYASRFMPRRRTIPAPVFIARLLGPIFVGIGIGVLVDLQHYALLVREAVRSPTPIYFAGIFALSAGLAILNCYRAWTADWRVIVTVLGWLMVIGGIVRIVLPRVTAGFATALYSGSAAMAIVGVVVLVVGGYLSFEGYRAK